MKSNGIRASKGAIASAVAIVAVIFVGCLLHSAHQDAKAQAISAARKEVSALRSIPAGDDRLTLEQRLSELRDRATAFRLNLLSQAQLDETIKDWETVWQVRPESIQPTAEYRKVQYVLALENAPMALWSEITGAVRRIQARPGIRLREIEISAEGEADQRIFRSVQIKATIYLKNDAMLGGDA